MAGSRFNLPVYNEATYNAGSSVSGLGSMGHIKIGGIPFVIAFDPKTGKHQFGRDEAPSFVNKIGSGDPSYRDSSFFPHWAQINWKNGSKQEYFDDGGKFFTSKNIDCTNETKLTLAKYAVAVGNPVADTTITCFDIDYSDSQKVFIGAENGHVYRLVPTTGTITDLGNVDSGQRINCILFTKKGGQGARAANSGQMLIGVGTPTSGTAKIYRYDGSFTLCTSHSQFDMVTAMAEYGDSVYAAFGKTAQIKKSNVKNFRTITAPTAATVAVAASGSVDAGDHYYKITFVTLNGETELGTASAKATTTAGNLTVNLSAIPVGPAADKVTARRVYRTKAGGSTYYLDGTISDNTTTTYASTKADADLGETDSTAQENTTAWQISQDIDYPGYIWSLKSYNGKLYAAGGHPENDVTQLFNGTLWSYDAYAWLEVFPFKHTVIQCAEVYDSLLFLGTIHGHLYVYNTASVDLLFKFPEGSAIYDMKVYDDKLYLAVSTRDLSGTEHSIFVFDRAGISKVYSDSTSIKPRCLMVSGDDLLLGGAETGKVFKLDPVHYHTSGELQSSYFDANLPSITKLWVEAIIEMDALPDGCKIEIHYKDDEASDWTKIDETQLVGVKLARFAFPKDTTSTKISWKVVLYTDTGKTLTPTIRKVIIKYVLQPDFYYLWRMRVVCPDNLVWLDNSEPQGLLLEGTQPGDTSIHVSPIIGFPDPNDEKMYAAIINKDTGQINEISYTGINGEYLIGCSGVTLHDLSEGTFEVKICGRHFHYKLLELKQSKSLLEYVDIDGIQYTVLFYNYSEDNWVLNTGGGLENEVPITLLQA